MSKKSTKSKKKTTKKVTTITPDQRANTYSQNSNYQSDTALTILNNARPDTGYQVTTPDKDPMDSTTWNMVLTKPNKESFYLWVEEIGIDFSMSGSYGQSRYRNQFFPKSFNQPTLNVKGRAPNQYQYNLFANFIREAHYEALKYSSTPSAPGRTYGAGNHPLPTVRVALKDAGKISPKNQSNVKGGHRGLIFEGYLQSVAAGAVRHEFIPSFEFNVVLASSVMTGNIGIYEDTLSTGSAIYDWMTLFKNNQFSGKGYGAVSYKDLLAQQAAEDAKNTPPGYPGLQGGENYVEWRAGRYVQSDRATARYVQGSDQTDLTGVTVSIG